MAFDSQREREWEIFSSCIAYTTFLSKGVFCYCVIGTGLFVVSIAWCSTLTQVELISNDTYCVHMPNNFHTYEYTIMVYKIR